MVKHLCTEQWDNRQHEEARRMPSAQYGIHGRVFFIWIRERYRNSTPIPNSQIRIQHKNRKLVLSENIPFRRKEMSPWVRKDRETVGKKIGRTSQTRFVGPSSVLPIEPPEHGIAHTWACLVVDHPRVYCSALRLAQPNAGLKLESSSCTVWGLQTCQVPWLKKSEAYGHKRRLCVLMSTT